METSTSPNSTRRLQTTADSLMDNITSTVTEMISKLNTTVDAMNGTGLMNATASVTKVTNYRYLYYGIYAIIMIPTIFGNLLILASIVKFKNLRRNMHILIGNLAFADLLVGVVVIPFDVIGDVYPVIKTQKYVCLTEYTIVGFTLFYSCISLFFITIERFLAFVFPIKHLNFDKRKLNILIIIGLGFTLAGSCTPFLWNNYVGSHPLPCFTEVVWPEAYRRIFIFIWFVIILVSLLMYCVIFRMALKMTITRSKRCTEKSSVIADSKRMQLLNSRAKTEGKTNGKPKENKVEPNNPLHSNLFNGTGDSNLNNVVNASPTMGDTQFRLPKDKETIQARRSISSGVTNSWKQGSKKSNTGEPKNHHNGRSLKTIRRTKMMVAVLVIFAICWGPYLIVNMIMTFYKSSLLHLLQKWLLGPAMLNSGMNWIIYSLSNEEFKKAFAAVLKCKSKPG